MKLLQDALSKTEDPLHRRTEPRTGAEDSPKLNAAATLTNQIAEEMLHSLIDDVVGETENNLGYFDCDYKSSLIIYYTAVCSRGRRFTKNLLRN